MLCDLEGDKGGDRLEMCDELSPAVACARPIVVDADAGGARGRPW
jgi:hypothetical protein